MYYVCTLCYGLDASTHHLSYYFPNPPVIWGDRLLISLLGNPSKAQEDPLRPSKTHDPKRVPCTHGPHGPLTIVSDCNYICSPTRGQIPKVSNFGLSSGPVTAVRAARVLPNTYFNGTYDKLLYHLKIMYKASTAVEERHTM